MLKIEIKIEKVKYFWDGEIAVYKDGDLFEIASVLMASSEEEAVSEALRLVHKILNIEE